MMGMMGMLEEGVAGATKSFPQERAWFARNGCPGD